MILHLTKYINKGSINITKNLPLLSKIFLKRNHLTRKKSGLYERI